MTSLINCPNCNATTPRSEYKVRDRHYGNDGVYTYAICGKCELEFLEPMPTNEELMKFYPEDSYYAYTLAMPDEDPTWKVFLRNILFLDQRTRDPKFDKPGRILDIGCGNGWFIYKWKKKGWEVKGVEPSKAAVESGTKAGLDITHGDLISAKLPSDYYDYIRLNHSFEHIPDPNEILTEIKRVLKPGGKVFIGVPNIGSANAKMFGEYWYYMGAPVHTFNYNDTSLPEMAVKNGFRNVKVIYNGNYRGIIGSIQIYLNKSTRKSSEDGFVLNFPPFKVAAGFISKLMNVFNTGDCMEVIFEK